MRDPAVRVADGEERRLIELTAEQGFGSSGWSPDGRDLLIPTNSAELRRYSIDTGDYVLVETPHSIIDDVTWSPDGRLVAMKADIPGAGRVRQYVFDLETGESQPVDRRRGVPRSASGLGWSASALRAALTDHRTPNRRGDRFVAETVPRATAIQNGGASSSSTGSRVRLGCLAFRGGGRWSLGGLV